MDWKGDNFPVKKAQVYTYYNYNYSVRDATNSPFYGMIQYNAIISMSWTYFMGCDVSNCMACKNHNHL